MKGGLRAISMALVLIAGGCGDNKGESNQTSTGPAGPDIPAPNGDWTQTIAETEEGGYRMGNPEAPVKLVEYASYTCPHCAEFSEKATAPLQNEYVKSGRVSWEFRPFLLFPTDVGASMLVRCHGAAASFLITEQLYAEQRQWAGRVQALPEAQLAQLQNLAPQQRAAALVQAAGLDAFFRQRGMPEARINSCLADQKGLDRLVEITERGTTEHKVRGTPTFFINGSQVEGAATWEALQPALREAVQ